MDKGKIYEVPGLKELLKEVEAIMETGQFTEVEEDVDPENETVIGEMTSFEKALDKLRREKRLAGKRICEECSHDDAADDETLCLKAAKLRRESELLTQMMWAAIDLRLENHKDGTGLRRGFKIVKLSSEKGAPPRLVSILLNRIFS